MLWLNIILGILMFGVVCVLSPIILGLSIIGLIVAIIAGSTVWIMLCSVTTVVSGVLVYWTRDDPPIVVIFRRW